MTTPTYDEVVNGLASADPGLTTEEQRTALALLRQLALGEPVTAEAVAARTGADPGDVAASIDRFPGVYRDDDGRVVGFWGLSVVEFPPHRYTVGGRELWTWCAWDPFILTPWLGGEAEVSSVDARTQEPISFRIADGRPRDLSHEQLTLSFLLPEDGWETDVIATFCHFVHFFGDVDRARAWTDEHPGTFVLPLDDAVRLGGVWGRQVMPDLQPEAL